MFSKKTRNLETKISNLDCDNSCLKIENCRLKRSNEDLTRRVEDLQDAIRKMTLLYSDIPELEKTISVECKTCKYAYRSNDYFNCGEVIGCKRKCVCSFYERKEEDEDDR